MPDRSSVPLSTLCEPSRSITYGIVQPGRLHDGGVPIVRVNNFRGNRLDLSERLHVAPEIEANYRRSRPRPGDVLVSLVGSIGQVAIAPPEIDGWNLARAVGLVPAKDADHASWIYYALQTSEAQHFIGRHANTTVQATFNLKDLARLPIPYPQKRDRELSLQVLRSLDDKIELNRRMNETLEAMAQAIFRDWFVDFGPTRRKMAGATDPVATMGGLTPDSAQAASVAALFPDTFGDEGLPTEWTRRPVGELSDIVGGSTPSTKSLRFWDGGTHAWATPKDLSRLSGVYLSGTERRITDTGLAQIGSGLSPAGSVLLSSRAPIGYLAIADEPVAVNQGFIVMRPTREFPTEFALFWCRESMEAIKANANGSTFQEISKRDFRPIPAISASEGVLESYVALVGPLLSLVRIREHENGVLYAARDLLLPKLMSGEVRLRTSELDAD